jgi:superfamily I DNA/RNA helicase
MLIIIVLRRLKKMIDKKEVEEWIKYIVEGLNAIEEYLGYYGFNESDKVLILQILLDKHLELLANYKKQSKRETLKEINEIKDILLNNFVGMKVY